MDANEVRLRGVFECVCVSVCVVVAVVVWWW